MKTDNRDRQLLLRLVEAISPGALLEASSGQEAIDADDGLIDDVADCLPRSSKLRIWENQDCLVTSRKIARNPWFEVAAERSRKRGWPVYVRSTGGSTVVHRPGILNVSMATVSPHLNIRPDKTYDDLTNSIIAGLAVLGVDAKVGFVSNSYCNGRFNICIDNKKIAGTASRVVRRKGRQIYLCHSSITVYGSISRDVDLVREFESQSIASHKIRTNGHISLQSLVQ